MFQPMDYVIINDCHARVIYVWPDRTLVRVQYRDTGQKESVSVSDVIPDNFPECRGCGAEISGEFSDLCYHCAREQHEDA